MPALPLVGLLYYFGTTLGGGANGKGLLFEACPHGVVPLYSFCSEINCTDGEHPSGNVVTLSDGTIMGTVADAGPGDNAGGVWVYAPVGSSRFASPGYHLLTRFCPYWGDCARYGRPRGTLVLKSEKPSSTLVEGTLSDSNGRGALWTVDVRKSGVIVISYLHWWNTK